MLSGLLTSSCGVKNAPVPPGGVLLPSVLDKYTQKVSNPVQQEDATKSEDKKTSSESNKEN